MIQNSPIDNIALFANSRNRHPVQGEIRSFCGSSESNLYTKLNITGHQSCYIEPGHNNIASTEFIVYFGHKKDLLEWFLSQWRHNERDCVCNHQPQDCLLNYLCRRRSQKTSKLRITVLCVGNSPVTGEFPTQRASNAENVFIWWRHHVTCSILPLLYKQSTWYDQQNKKISVADPI